MIGPGATYKTSPKKTFACLLFSSLLAGEALRSMDVDEGVGGDDQGKCGALCT